MKTLADLKRRLIIGALLDCKHLQSIWNPGTRKVVHADTVKFGLETTKQDGSITTSYCDWPKAKDLKVISADTFQIWGDWYNSAAQKDEYMPILEYTFVEPPK